MSRTPFSSLWHLSLSLSFLLLFRLFFCGCPSFFLLAFSLHHLLQLSYSFYLLPSFSLLFSFSLRLFHLSFPFIPSPNFLLPFSFFLSHSHFTSFVRPSLPPPPFSHLYPSFLLLTPRLPTRSHRLARALPLAASPSLGRHFRTFAQSRRGYCINIKKCII